MNPLVISDEQLMQFIGQYLWPMLRISGFYFAVPVIGARTVPARIRIVLTLFTTLLVVPMLPPAPVVSLVSVEAMMMVVKEMMIGISMGFMLQVVLQVFVLAGQFVAMKMGLGFASMNDPSSGVSVTVLSQFYLTFTTLLFLSVNGHIVVIQMLVDSFASLPIMGNGLGADEFLLVISMGSWMFGAALVITLPLFTALLIVNMSFGVMSRSAPQMNVFTVGFPITLLFGLLIVWFSLTNFLPIFDRILDEGLAMLQALIGAP